MIKKKNPESETGIQLKVRKAEKAVTDFCLYLSLKWQFQNPGISNETVCEAISSHLTFLSSFGIGAVHHY